MADQGIWVLKCLIFLRNSGCRFTDDFDGFNQPKHKQPIRIQVFALLPFDKRHGLVCCFQHMKYPNLIVRYAHKELGHV